MALPPIDLRALAAGNASLELLARQLVEGFITGLHKSPYHGFSVEFAEHKAYNPGETLRYVDWKLFGRTDRLYTRQFEEETNLRCHLVVDCSPSMYYPRPGYHKLRFSCVAAASLALMLQRQRDAIGLTLFADGVEEQSRIKSTAVHVSNLLGILERRLRTEPPARGGTNLPQVLHTLAEQLGQRALVVLFSDMLQPGAEDEVFKALQHLRHNKHEIIFFHVLHRASELELDLPGRRTYMLVDAETGDQVRVRPLELQERYKEAREEWLHGLRLRLAQNRIDLVEADTEAGVTPILQAYLAKRARMR